MEETFGALDISASGLTAQRTRLNVIAENLANAETTRTIDGGPYRRKLVRFGAEPAAPFSHALEAMQTTAVKVLGIEESDEPMRRIHQPAHPDADASGYLTLPNINPILEMVDLLSATRAYEANVTAVQAAKSMGAKALEIGR